MNGFDTVCQEGEDGKQNDKLAQKELDAIAAAESSCAKTLKQLSTSRYYAFDGLTKIGTLNDAWITFRTGLLGMMSQNYETNARDIRAHGNALFKLRKLQRKKRKVLVEKGQIILATYARINQKQIQAREAYEKAVDTAENIIREGEDDQRIANAIKCVDNAYFAYQDASEERKKGQKTYKEQIGELLDELERLQRVRYAEWARVRKSMTEEREKLYDTFKMLLAATERSLEKVDVEYDTDLFVKRFPAPEAMEPLPEPCAPLDLMPDIVRRRVYPAAPKVGPPKRPPAKIGKSLSHGSSSIIRIPVPPGAKAGQKICVSHQGQDFYVAVPNDAAARGTGTFPVRLPNAKKSNGNANGRLTQLRRAHTDETPKRHRSIGKDILLKALSPSTSQKDAAAKARLSTPVSQTELVRALRSSTKQPLFCIAKYDFNGSKSDDLSFREGDQIVLIDEAIRADGWWKGSLNGAVGFFPKNYVRVVTGEERPLPPLPPRMSAKAPSRPPRARWRRLRP